MDTTDEAILAALRDDARASLSDLAAALRLSRTTVRARLARLQQSGEILSRDGGFGVPATKHPLVFYLLIAKLDLRLGLG